MGTAKRAEREVANKALMRRFYQEFWNKGNLAFADEVIAHGLIHDQMPPDWPRGREGFKRLVQTWRTAFPDLHEEVEFVLAEGDRVLSRFRLTGTHRGVFYGLEPTGKRINVRGVDVARVIDGTIVEYFYHEDTLGLFRQLGQFPSDMNAVAGTVATDEGWTAISAPASRAASGRGHRSGDGWPEVANVGKLSNSFLGNLIEICIVTRDYRRVMEGLVRLGIGPWRVYTFDSSTVAERTYRGESADYVIKVCFADADNVVWEIMQPLGGPTIFQEFLDQHGEGIHHVAFDCEGIPWNQRLAEFKARGLELTQSGKFANATSFAFFGTESMTGTTFETYLSPDEYVSPDPEEWFPAAPPSEREERGG